MNTDQAINKLLIDDLRSRVQGSSDAKGQAVAIRAFLETVHRAMGKLLSFDADRVHIDRWTVSMTEYAKNHAPGFQKPHTDKYALLSDAYRVGNMSAHENAEALLVNQDRCFENFRRIEILFPALVADMRALGLDLESEVLRWRATLAHENRAQKLVDAILAATGADAARLESEIWPTIDAFLVELKDQRVDGLRKNPKLDKRIQLALVVSVASRASERSDCPLRTIASRLAGVDLDVWLVEDKRRQEMLDKAPRPLPIFRVEVERTPTRDGRALRHAVAYAEDGVGWPVPGDYPLIADTASEFVLKIVTVFRLYAKDCHTRTGVMRLARDFVLQIAVNKKDAMQDWEALRPSEHRCSLLDEFRAITVDPVDEYDYPAVMAEPLASNNLALVWESSTETVNRKFPKHVVLLAGPRAWQTELDGLPAVLWMMSQRAGAAFLPDEDMDAAKSSLSLGDLSVVSVMWPDLVDRLTELKRSRGRETPHVYRVILTDERYRTLPAFSL